ncbi:sugar transferase [Alphaproteobacteria bacterium]|nr:sugar transferase [Alphaproteobacteria bacterium]
MKRLFDFVLSFFGLVIFSPIIVIFMFLIWRQDYCSPFYIAKRVGLKGREFDMVKLRSMIKNADKSGVDSTSTDDIRITKVGHIIRKFKLDELMQLWNVLLGDMSIVGPRPNVKRETDLYTDVEKTLLSVKPGITDISSIVFSDEGDILSGKDDPDISYHQLIRPGKSQLGLFYISHRGFIFDIYLIVLTALALVSKPKALKLLASKIKNLNASDELVNLASRAQELVPSPPPGAINIVTSRDGAVH